MRKYNPGGPTGPGNVVTPDKTQPVNPPMNPPVNSTVPQPTTPPVQDITSNATAQVPGSENPLLDAVNRYRAAGYGKFKAKKLAMEEVQPGLAGKQAAYEFKQQKRAGRPSMQNVLEGINTGLDLVNKGTNVAGAISNVVNRQYGGAKKSKFQAGGGVMSGKDLRRAKSYQMGGESGNLKKQTRKSNRAAKAYGKAASSYSKGNMKKGDRQMKRGNRISGRK
jgi:hypothetical protein